MILLLLLSFKTLWGCVDTNKSDEENISCIVSIEEKSDITNNLVSQCSKLAAEDKFVGYLCLCRINNLNAKTDLAIISCSKAKVKNPFSVYPHIEFADIYLSKKRKDLAKTEIEFAISIDSQNFHANLKAAEIFEATDPDKAIRYYTKALDILKSSNENFIIGKKTFIENRIGKLNEALKKRKSKEEKDSYIKCISSYQTEKDPVIALEKIKGCMKMRKQHTQSVYVDYIKILYKNKRYDEIVKNISIVKKPNNEIIRIIADSLYHTANYSQAIKYYKEIVKDDTHDFELLSVYADALEKSKDNLTALEIYSKMNTIKPSKKLEDKIDELKMTAMSDNDILNDLKIRGFVEKEKVMLLPAEKKLFMTVKLAERNGAIRYLSEKYPGYANIIWTNPQNNHDMRITYQGYNLYIKYVSQRFIKEIEKTASDPRDIFVVKDRNSDPIFDKSGLLTYEGLKCYYEYEKTKTKNWFFPHETPPSSTLTSTVDKKISDFNLKKKELEKLGYEEITEQEYLWLLKATNCPEDVLENPPCSVRKVESADGIRYFMCMKEGFLCNRIQLNLANYIASYRSGNTDITEGRRSTPFFGSPSTVKKRFCENGKIWQGEDD